MNTARRRMGLAAALALGAAPALACPGEVAGFVDLADRLALIEEEGATILNAEFLESRARACAEAWVVDILTHEGEVLSVILDARTLAPRPGDRGPLAEFLREAEEEDTDEIYPVHIQMTGGPENDLMEGDWSDDVMTGGPGQDIFVATPGQDIVTDFVPGEDVLDVGDFARLEDGYGLLRSFADLQRASRKGAVDGQPALILDLAGEHEDWTLSLIGLEIGDLQNSVHFGLQDPAPDVEIDRVPAFDVTASDGSLSRFAASDIEDGPAEGRLIRGTAEAYDAIEAWLFERWSWIGEDL